MRKRLYAFILSIMIAVMFHFNFCPAATAGLVAVEFDARITGSNMEGWPVGERMSGYFTYDPNLSPGRQTNSRPVLAFGKPGAMNEFYWHDFTVYNDWASDPGDPVKIDGISIRFDFMCCSPERYGSLTLTTTNTTLFASNSLPNTIPPLERFERTKNIGLIREDVQPYGTVSILIERLSVAPGSGSDQIVIFGVQRSQAGLSMRFVTQQSTSYAVEFTDDLASTWLTLINIASPREPIVTVNAPSDSARRFYRIRGSSN